MTTQDEADLLSRLPSTDEIAEHSLFETMLLRDYLAAARKVVCATPGFAAIEQERFGLGLAGVLAVFAMRVRLTSGATEDLWVVAGDPPSAVLPLAAAPNPFAAAEAYVALAERWAGAVLADEPELPRLQAPATPAHARDVAAKMHTIRRIVLPALTGIAEGGHG
ncbi:MAG: hypothetical protein IPI49_19880 [Myxococcales bacterium]|nr:hypothetical protein [Myxococcales bacterium]